jgi:uncharacterized membrane protein YidH (DUF202 family)
LSSRFGLLIRALERTTVSGGVLNASGFIGIALTLFGALLTARALVRYLQSKRGIERGAPEVEARLGITMTVGLTLTGVTLAGYLAFAH